MASPTGEGVTAAAPPGGPDGTWSDRPDAEGLRVRTARGTIVNGAFHVGVNLVTLLKGFVIAAFLTAQDYGLWGLLAISLGTLLALPQIGINDKYIQQEEPDQERAFQIAFTLQAALCAGFLAAVAVGMPLFALLYGTWEIVAPGYVLGLAVPAIVLQTPLWVHYRRMDFVRQRTLQAFDPVMSLVVTAALAAAGLGYWAVVIGTVCGSWAAGLAALRASPYRLALVYERGSLREYATFSWPLLVSSASGLVLALAPILVAQRTGGLATVGAITLAGSIALYTARIDDVVTQTLYPAICAAQDRLDVLFESFSKSNRLALLWGMPCGVGLALFAEDLVEHVLGGRWHFAVGLIQAFAVIAAVNQVGFNWHAFYRARGNTRPIAVASVVMLVCTLGVSVPLLAWEGLSGFAWGMGIATAVSLVVRVAFLARIFPAFRVLGHAARAIAPTVPAAAAVLALRLADGDRTPARALAELAVFVAVAAVATLVAERRLLRELVGYLRGRPVAPSAGLPA